MVTNTKLQHQNNIIKCTGWSLGSSSTAATASADALEDAEEEDDEDCVDDEKRSLMSLNREKQIFKTGDP